MRAGVTADLGPGGTEEKLAVAFEQCSKGGQDRESRTFCMEVALRGLMGTVES